MKWYTEHFDSQIEVFPTIREIGFKLTPKERAEIEKKLDLLQERAPSMSTIRLSLFKEGGKIKGSLTIFALGKNFRSVASGTSAINVYQEVEMEADYQILKWKKTRFLNKYVGLPIDEQQNITGGLAV